MPAKKKKPLLDLSLIPGTTREQRAAARRARYPIKIEPSGSQWAVVVLGIPVGFVGTKDEARSAAHLIGRYKLNLGDLVYTYTEGYGP